MAKNDVALQLAGFMARAFLFGTPLLAAAFTEAPVAG